MSCCCGHGAVYPLWRQGVLLMLAPHHLEIFERSTAKPTWCSPTLPQLRGLQSLGWSISHWSALIAWALAIGQVLLERWRALSTAC